VGNVLTIRFERFTVFKPPALPEVMTLRNPRKNQGMVMGTEKDWILTNKQKR
jgi:hypothetical protein